MRKTNKLDTQGSKGSPIPTLGLYDHFLWTDLLMFYFCTISLNVGMYVF